MADYHLMSVVMDRIFIVYDPVFFMLSKYFAIKPSNRSLKDCYLDKVLTIILPLFRYSVLLYLYASRSDLGSISLAAYCDFFAEKLEDAWRSYRPGFSWNLHGKVGTRIAIIGILLWIHDIIFATFSIPRNEPIYSWLFARFQHHDPLRQDPDQCEGDRALH